MTVWKRRGETHHVMLASARYRYRYRYRYRDGDGDGDRDRDRDRDRDTAAAAAPVRSCPSLPRSRTHDRRRAVRRAFRSAR